MRNHGTLTKWKEDRGFGFISPAQGDDIFVHISEFPRDGVRPRINELISFEIEPGSKGKFQAVRVMRPAGHAKSHAKPRQTEYSRNPQPSGRARYSMLAVLVLAAIGTYGYSRLNSHVAVSNFSITESQAISASPAVNFKCDGRTMCSQMTSCAEATYFLQNCPTVKMDGDNDGRPCEQQWCNH